MKTHSNTTNFPSFIHLFIGTAHSHCSHLAVRCVWCVCLRILCLYGLCDILFLSQHILTATGEATSTAHTNIIFIYIWVTFDLKYLVEHLWPSDWIFIHIYFHKSCHHFLSQRQFFFTLNPSFFMAFVLYIFGMALVLWIFNESKRSGCVVSCLFWLALRWLFAWNSTHTHTHWDDWLKWNYFDRLT